MKITAHMLEKSGACQEAIKFVKRNFPNGFDRDHIRADESMGEWYEWLKCREYDSQGNMTKKTYPDGGICLYEYDSQGNMTKVTYSDGGIWLYEYDYAPDGSLISMRENGERIVWFE